MRGSRGSRLSQYQERTIHLLEEKWKLLVLLERTEKEKEEMMTSIQQLNVQSQRGVHGVEEAARDREKSHAIGV